MEVCTGFVDSEIKLKDTDTFLWWIARRTDSEILEHDWDKKYTKIIPSQAFWAFWKRNKENLKKANVKVFKAYTGTWIAEQEFKR